MSDLKTQLSSQPSATKPQAAVDSQEWSSGTFDCFDSPDNLCLKGTFCPCFVYGKTQARLRDPSLASYDRFNNDCLFWAGASYCCGFSWILTFIKRKEIRERYGIQGDPVKDGLLSACCGCCSIIQQEKEVLHRQASGDVAQGYQAPSGMSAAP